MDFGVYVSKAGVLQTGAVLAFENLKTFPNGTDRSGDAPSFTEVGGGWYTFAIIHGTAPWQTVAEALCGVLDLDSDAALGLSDVERYQPFLINKAGTFGLQRLVNKRDFDQSTKDETIYGDDNATAELDLDHSEAAGVETITPIAPS